LSKPIGFCLGRRSDTSGALLLRTAATPVVLDALRLAINAGRVSAWV
jgi:hypothetical protein